MSEVRLNVEARTEFGKGAARRTRRAGKIPAVLYGHGSDPKHVSLPAVEFARVIRENGHNAVLELRIGSTDRELVLTKTITTHPLKNYIEHVDLLSIKRGEKVNVDVPIVVSGDPEPGTLLTQDLNELSVEADALKIPEQIELSVDGAEAGTQYHASDLSLPDGVELVSDPELLVVNIVVAPTAEDMESEGDTDGAVAEEEPAAESSEES
ncbi:large subunit ribosomal protein L25 [Tamaricihabitans halophyticus]|uniref:Large ribosomal subunit protein bL25 n=1 Tax=Tamaricihabitans halophyticus TaxID=1262583 RepID=A0A4R2R3Y9_9PSEU|nr:50S ribosomal protein L25/general stress protein Ctc [Tamaricihabitans halophyticus]TCP56368.1 large subunit ribosomal protein L25 [Tamaricihabitans halophyticus]